MVDMAIDRNVITEVTVVHQPTANVHPDVVNVRRIDDAVGIHVSDSQRHGGRCIHRTGGTVYTRDGHGNIGTVTVNVPKLDRDSVATKRRAGHLATGRGRGPRYARHVLREGKHDRLQERATISLPAFHPGQR